MHEKDQNRLARLLKKCDWPWGKIRSNEILVKPVKLKTLTILFENVAEHNIFQSHPFFINPLSDSTKEPHTLKHIAQDCK